MNFTICKSLDDCTCENCMSNRNRSELELRIRKEAMDAVDEMIACEADEEEYFKGKLLKIKDQLNLLWGDDK